MADYQAVGAMTAPIKAPDTFGQLSSILGIQQQRQQLQQQAQTLQQQQLATQQQQGLSDFFGSWSPGDHVGADGTMDIDSAHGSDAYKNLPGNARAAVDEKLIQIKTGQLSNAKSLLDLGDSARSYVAQGLGGLDTDPDVIAGNDNGKAKVQAALKQVSDTGGPPAAKFALTYNKITDGDLKPGDLPQRISALQKSAVNAQQQIQLRTPQPTPIQKKGGIDYVNTNPNAPQPVGSQVGQTVTGQGVTPAVISLPNQQSAIVSPSGVASPLTSTGTPAATAPQGKLQPIPAPKATDPGPVQARYNAQMEEARQHVASVSAAANDTQNGVVPTRYRNDQIVSILNDHKFSPTGPGAAQLNWLASKLPGASGDDFQKLGHYLAQNNAAIAQKMGVPNTNLGAETAAAGSGNTSQNKGALLEITKVNDAMNTGLDLYNQGLAKLTNNGADPSKVAAYRNAFGKNYDVNVLRFDDALRRNDRPEMDTIAAKAGPQGLKNMAVKRKALHSLADTGDLP